MHRSRKLIQFSMIKKKRTDENTHMVNDYSVEVGGWGESENPRRDFNLSVLEFKTILACNQV